MFIKLQQKITKKNSQLTTANSQLSIIISNSASHIITNAHIEIIIFDKNEKSTSRKRERLSKKYSVVFFRKINDVISKKFERFSKNKAFVTVTFESSIVKNFQFSQNERTIANQITSTTFSISLMSRKQLIKLHQ